MTALLAIALAVALPEQGLHSASETVPPKLLLDLPFVDGSGTIITGRSAFARQARLHGDVKWTGSPAMLEFDGETGAVYLPAEGRPTPDLKVQNFTLALWVKPDVPVSTERAAVMKSPFSDGYGGLQIYAKPEAGNWEVTFYVNFGRLSPYPLSFGPIRSGELTHLTATYDHQQLVLYVNGRAVGQTKETRDVHYRSQNVMVIGAAHAPRKWDGVIAGVKLYDGALSPSEVIKLAAEAPSKTKAPVAKKRSSSPTYYAADRQYGPDFNLCHNLVQNPSFEAGLHHWESRLYSIFRLHEERYIDIDSTVARTGRRSLYLSAYKDDAMTGWAKTFAIPVETGKTYTVSFFVKGDPAAVVSCGIWSGKWGVFPKGTAARATDEWVRHSFQFEAPNNAAAVVFKLRDYFPPADGHAWIDDVQMEEDAAPTEFTKKPVCVQLATDRFDNIFQPGESMNARLVICTSASARGQVQLSLRNFENVGFHTQSLPFSADTSGTATLRLPLETIVQSRPGLYVLRADLELESGFKDYDFLRFGIMRSLDGTHKHKNLFSSYYQFPQQRTPEWAARRWIQTGLGSVRLSYGGVPTPGRVALNGKHHILTFSSPFGRHLTSVPGNARPYWNEPRNPRRWPGTVSEAEKMPSVKYDYLSPKIDNQRVAANTVEVVKANPHVHHWHLVLEPSHDMHTDPAKLKTFMATQCAVAQAIRHAAPEAKIIGMAPTNMYEGGIKEVENFCRAGMLDFVDIVAIHPYRPRPENPDFDRDTATFVRMLDRGGFKGDIWFTEGINHQPVRNPRYGLEVTQFNNFWRTGPLSYDLGEGEQIAAAYTMRMYLVAFKYGDRVKLFCDNTNFYIMDGCRTLRLVGWVPNVLGNLLGNADFVRDIDVSDRIRGYLFQDERTRPVAVLWNIDTAIDDRKAPPSRVTLPFAPDEVQALDFVAAPIAHAKLSDLPITRAPVFVRGRPGSMKTFSERLAQIKTDGGLSLVKIRLKVAQGRNVAVTLLNRVSREVRGRAEIVCAGSRAIHDGVAIPARGDIKLQVPIPPTVKTYDSVTVQVRFLPAGQTGAQAYQETFGVLFARRQARPITIDGDLSDWPTQYGSPLPDAFKDLPIKRGGLSQKVLRKIEGRDFSWKGRDDLSATMYAAWGQTHFYLALDVTDDTFVPPKSHVYCWDHDSLQVYFDTFADARSQPFKGYDNSDYNYNIAPAKDQVWVYRNQTPEQQLCFLEREVTDAIPVAFRRTETGYIYEMKFPARQITPIDLKSGSAFGFALILNENDDYFTKRVLTLTAPGTHPYRRPDLWPVMILVDE